MESHFSPLPELSVYPGSREGGGEKRGKLSGSTQVVVIRWPVRSLGPTGSYEKRRRGGKERGGPLDRNDSAGAKREIESDKRNGPQSTPMR